MIKTLSQQQIKVREALKQYVAKGEGNIEEMIEDFSDCGILAAQYYLQEKQKEFTIPLRILSIISYMEILKRMIASHPMRLLQENIQLKEDKDHLPIEVETLMFLENCGFVDELSDNNRDRPITFKFDDEDPFFKELGTKIATKLMSIVDEIDKTTPQFVETLLINRQAVSLSNGDTNEIIVSDRFNLVPLLNITEGTFDPLKTTTETCDIRFKKWYEIENTHWSSKSSSSFVAALSKFITRKHPNTRIFQGEKPDKFGLCLIHPDGTFTMFAFRYNLEEDQE